MTQALRTPDDWYASLFDTTTIDPPARSPGVDLGFSSASESSYASFGPTVAPDPPRRTPDDWYAELLGPSSIDTTARAPSLTGALRQQRPAIPETTRPAGIPAEPMPAFPERSVEVAQAPALLRGLVTGWYQANPEMFGGGVEALGRAMESDQLVKMGQEMGKKRSVPQAYLMSAVGRGKIEDVKSIDEALTWLGEQAGQGIASSGPTLAANLIGRVGGAAATDQ